MSEPMIYDDERKLLLLALLDQYHADLAAGLHCDLADYYAASPELEADFLEMVLSLGPLGPDDTAMSSDMGALADMPPIQPLSTGARRALASLPGFGEFAVDTDERPQRRVAEERAPYSASDTSGLQKVEKDTGAQQEQ